MAAEGRAAQPGRVVVWVRPGAWREAVGGARGDPPALVVAVRERAVEGRATAAACRAVAAALGLRAGQVTCVRGASARTKVLEVAAPPPDLAARVAALLGAPPGARPGQTRGARPGGGR